MADGTDFYEVLGVPRDADAEQIQRAYRTLARRHHPDVDKSPGAEDRFKKINEAYTVLSDPKSRRKYDRFGEAWRQVPDDYEWAGARAGGGGFESFGGFGGPREYSSRRGGIDVEDLLEGLFGQRSGRARGYGPAPGADTEAEITISVEDAYHGGRRRITLPGPDGHPRQYDVNIPAGVTEGQRIRLAGQGSSGAGGGPPGDLYLVVHLAPHPRYHVEGRDIIVDLPAAPWEAVLGAAVSMETPGGVVQVRVPAGSSCGRRLRLRERGLPNPRGKPGDLLATVKIVVPTRPAEQERRLFEQLAKVSSFEPRGGT